MPVPVSRTINLTRISEDNHYRDVLKRKFDYDSELDDRAAFKLEYLNQKTRAEEIYCDKSSNHVSALIEGVEQFLVKSLGTDDPRGPGLYSETVLLDMQLSDHEIIFSKIEKAVKKHSSNFLVMRLKANIGRRKITDFLEPVRQSKRVFLIVEQTESLDRATFATLAGYLRGRLSDPVSPTNTILILFCFSVSSQYPIDLTESFGLMRGIYKQTNETNSTNLRLLLESCDLKVKLDPLSLDFIYDQSVNTDPSITNIKFLHIFALFEHYHTTKSLLSKDEFKKLEEQHKNMCDDLLCLAAFLKEPGAWPHDASDIYGELIDHKNLAESRAFFDALQVIKTTPKERISDRFQWVADESRNSTNKGVASLILSYEDVIKDKENQAKLIKDLMSYARKIGCSFEQHKYFCNFEALIRQCFTAVRYRVPKTFLNSDTYFGILFNKIMHSEGNESISELYHEVLDDYRRLIKTNRDSETVDGVARAIFVDMIESMEHQNIIKIDSRAKSKIYQRLAWPLLQ